jgi:hypothetical protein
LFLQLSIFVCCRQSLSHRKVIHREGAAFHTNSSFKNVSFRFESPHFVWLEKIIHNLLYRKTKTVRPSIVIRRAEKLVVLLLTFAMKRLPLKESIRSIIWDVGCWVNFQIHEITAYCEIRENEQQMKETH